METLDQEILAMSECYKLMKPLDENSQARVIQWLIGKLDLNTLNIQTKYSNKLPLSDTNGSNRDGNNNHEEEENQENGKGFKTIVDFDSVAEAFAAASPNSEWEKTLVVATYLQQKNGFTEIKGFDVNKELKNLRHGQTHITESFGTCIAKKPQMILQL